MATNYGRDLSCTTALDTAMREVSGDELMRQVILRRLITPKGSLLSDPNAITLDVRRYMSKDVDERELMAMRGAIHAAILDDERILSVKVSMGYDAGQRTATIGVKAIGARGPFSLTLAVSDVSVTVLRDAS